MNIRAFFSWYFIYYFSIPYLSGISTSKSTTFAPSKVATPTSSNNRKEINEIPFSVVIPKGTPLKQISVRLSLIIYNNSNSKEIGYKDLSLPYLLNTPVYAVDHLIDSTTESRVKTVHIAKVNIISKFFLSNMPIAFHITKISMKKIFQENLYHDLSSSKDVTTPKGIINAFIIVKWKDQEIFRTNVIKNVSIYINKCLCFVQKF
jgi:hypothetical protein